MASLFFYDSHDIYFADEGESLTVGSSDQTAAIDIAVKVDDEQVASFNLDTFNGLAIIPIGEILRSVEKRNQAIPSSMVVIATQEEASVRLSAICVFCRKYGEGSRSAVFANWLSTGPSKRRTFPEAHEILPFLRDDTAVSQKAMIQLTFEDGSIQTRVFADLKAKTGEGLDVSPSAVQAFARSLTLYSQILSYSLWIEYSDSVGDATSGESVAFELIRDHLSRISYKFVGNRGAYEYIHASGELKRSIDNETRTFITSGIETELNNEATKSMEQNSGYLSSPSEAEFWFAFLSSKERYVVEADGTERLIIVEDSKPSFTDLKIGEISFTWHYSNKNNTVIKRVSIPLESLSIAGDSTIENDQNQLQLGVIYNPAATTQRGVVWELLDGSRYASLSSSGLLTVKKGAANASVTVKATSSANGEISATKVFSVTYREEAAPLYGLTISSNVESPGIALTVDGQTVEYFDGILISEGAAVVITISKSGYGTQTRSFEFNYAGKDQYFELVASIEATISHPNKISYSAQNVSYTIADPSGHGWVIDYDGPEAYDIITSGGVISGNAYAHTGVIEGIGDAVVYLHVTANSNPSERSIVQSPFYFQDQITNTKTYLDIQQDGTSSGNVPVTSVSLNKNTTTIAAGRSEKLVATVLPSNATNKTLAWTTSRASVATVDQDGTIHAIGAGTCVITASSTDGSNKSATCTVTVTATTVPVTGISLNKDSLSLEEGETMTLSASVAPANATNKAVSWRSSDTSVATVSASGVVSALSEGTCNIVATTADGSFTASCQVNVRPAGSIVPDESDISIDDISIAASATSASGVIRCTGIMDGSIEASENAPWITGVTIDTSGNVPRIRLNISKNTLSNSRSALVTVTALDTSGNTITTTFTLTQRGYSTSDVPCTAMNVYGDDSISNVGNQAEYTASFTPGSTTQAACSWSLTDGSGHSTNYATLIPNGLSATVRVLPGASNLTLKLRATNSYNSNIYAEKTIIVNYDSSSSEIQVSTGSVRVHAIDTSDNTPVVTTRDIQSGSLIVKQVSGFILGASLEGNLLVTEFTQNPSSSSRSGSVTLEAIDLNGNPIAVVIQYIQAGTTAGDYSFAPTALNVQQVGGKVNAKFEVIYLNRSAYSTVFYTPGWTLKGYDAEDNELFSKSGSLSDKTVAALASESEIYLATWTGSLGMAVRYSLVVSSGNQSETYLGDGNDEIE